MTLTQKNCSTKCNQYMTWYPPFSMVLNYVSAKYSWHYNFMIISESFNLITFHQFLVFFKAADYLSAIGFLEYINFYQIYLTQIMQNFWLLFILDNILWEDVMFLSYSKILFWHEMPCDHRLILPFQHVAKHRSSLSTEKKWQDSGQMQTLC